MKKSHNIPLRFTKLNTHKIDEIHKYLESRNLILLALGKSKNKVEPAKCIRILQCSNTAF